MIVDGAARWYATTLSLQKKVVGVKFAMPAGWDGLFARNNKELLPL